MSVLGRTWRLVMGGTLVIMSASVALGVVSRYVFNAPVFWTDELARYALVWMTFLGGAELLMHREGHISVGYFRSLMSPALDRIAGIISMLLVLAILLMIAFGGFLLIRSNVISVSAALGVPMYTVYAVIPFSAALGIIFVLRNLFRALKGREAAQ